MTCIMTSASYIHVLKVMGFSTRVSRRGWERTISTLGIPLKET